MSKTGVVIGNTLTDAGWDEAETDKVVVRMKARFKSCFPETSEDTLAGGLSNTISGQISKFYHMRGGAYTVDGACASSLIAITLGADYLRAGKLDAVSTRPTSSSPTTTRRGAPSSRASPRRSRSSRRCARSGA